MRSGILFDMDGVLVDSGPAHQESWRELARRHDTAVTDAQFRACFGRPSRDIIRIVWGDRISADDIRRYAEEKETVYRELIRGRVPLMPGSRELLSDLHAAGFVLAVASSGPPENVNLVLDEGRLREFLAAVVHGFDIAHGKPAPDCFLLAAERIDMAASQCVVIEDAPVGIEAARGAGMPVIALTGTHPTEALWAAGAARVVARLSDITVELIGDVLGAR